MSYSTALLIRILWAISLYGAASAVSPAQKIRIDKDFPGGNILVEKLHGDTVWMKPDSENTEGTWFYWYFRITGMAGRTMTFNFMQKDVFARYGPVYSINEPGHWRYLGEQSYRQTSFRYRFGKEDTVAWFAMAVPYTQDHLEHFLANLRHGGMVKKGVLCTSGGGREVEELHLEPGSGAGEHKVLITVRHHACEMMASYVMEGIIRSICNERDLAFLRDHVAFRIIPFMDKDGVEQGDQGKNRIPRDHNRDYDGVSIHRSTAALRAQIPAWSQGRMKIALDLHCPWIREGHNELIYMVGSEDADNEAQQMVFSRLLERFACGELPYCHAHFLPFGESWNTARNYSQGKSFSSWAQGIEGVTMAGTLEFPYANVLGTPVTRDNARIFGRAVAFAIQEYLLQSGPVIDR